MLSYVWQVIDRKENGKYLLLLHNLFNLPN